MKTEKTKLYILTVRPYILTLIKYIRLVYLFIDFARMYVYNIGYIYNACSPRDIMYYT